MRDYRLIVNGELVESVSGNRFNVINPATSEVIGSVPDGVPEDAVSALQAAERAFPGWAALPPTVRADYMHKSAELIRARKRDIAVTLTMEQGKPLRDAEKEVQDAAAAIDFFADEGIRIRGEVIPTGVTSALSIVVKQPIGVCVAITPWNYPVSLLAWKVGPALAAGCSIVAKPASETPLSSIEFVRCFLDAGVPKGVINIVTGSGGKIGRELVQNPITKKVALTGSTLVGKCVASLAGEHLKKVSLELGGHSPFIVFGDADLKSAVAEGVRRSFRNMGQICNAVNRILVHESIADEFIDMFVEGTKNMTIGNGLNNPDVDLGPMVNEEGIKRTMTHIQDALDRGARLLCGGRKPAGKEFERGFFLKPAVLVDVPRDSIIMQEETFGPAVAIVKFESLDEAIHLANATQYGLVAYAYTQDIETIITLVNMLDFGTVCINNTVAASVQAPYGGWKESGVGVELSHHAMDEYLHIKHVRIQG
ncbi:MAG: NAD-dependent succinate-semialdehyde dehydrogenase [Firmicutes bacterium]|nr:NAD-dependent succinate-semialdehyde dehydrogenase [Bacillota bacterium]